MINSLSDGLDDSADFAEFQGNPVAFGEEVLGETYTDDVKTLMESVRDNPVTVAISANATGKTHGALGSGCGFTNPSALPNLHRRGPSGKQPEETALGRDRKHR